MFKFKLYILLVVSLFSTRGVVAQNSYNLLSLYTDTVNVSSSYKPALTTTVGARQSSISKQIITQSSVKSLADLLTENSMIYIKSYGDGALATSSFRGTNSTHTAVNWNGIKINPAMSGGFDFSQFPVFFIDGVTMSHGGSDFSGGSGAIGGNVAITSSITNSDSTFLSAFAEVGSFSTYAAGVSLKYGTEKSTFRTKLYYKNSKNDFKYLNKVYGKDDFYERREESAYSIGGAMQEAFFKLKNNSTISSALMVTYGDRELPQPIVVNVTRSEQQKTFSTKFSTKYQKEYKNSTLSIIGGYVFDNFDYSKSFGANETDYTHSQNNAHTILLKGAFNHKFSNKFRLNSSLIYNHDIVFAESYSKSTVNRDVASLNIGGEWNPIDKLTVDASVMGEINNGKAAPTGTAGINYSISKSLSIKASTSYNYKFPNLNDLYWIPGGNPDLNPERGVAADATLSYSFKPAERLYLKLEGTYYVMNIKDWIIWMPKNGSYLWEPQNILRVLSHGAEISFEANYIADSFKAKIGASYTYSPSTSRERAFDKDNSYKKQLPYIPINKANVRFGADYKKLFASWQIYYVDKRYTTSDNSRSTAAYTINDFEIGYNLTINKRIKMPIKLKASNLFNTYWESTQYYPMPLRSFMLNIGITI